METLYHGSSALFNQFDMSHTLEGAGNIKFGYGIYLSTEFSSAALYARKACHDVSLVPYIYTVEVPELTEGHYIHIRKQVDAEIIIRAEKILGKSIPQKEIQDGKHFRKWLAKELTGKKKVDIIGEKAASDFLDSIGVIAIVWPHTWRNPQSPLDRVICNEKNVRIIRIETVDYNSKGKALAESKRLVKEL